MSGINVAECLKVFRATVDQGSFSAAAKLLHISPAWAAKSVTGLEEHLGVTLLVRSTRSLRLTDAGNSCYLSAGKIADELETLQNHMRNEATEISGTVRLNIPSIFAIHLMGALVVDFQNKYPKIRLDITASDTFSDVLNEEYDIVLRLTPSLNNSGLIAQKLLEMPRVICATPTYLTQTSKLDCLTDLQTHRCLLYNGLHIPDIWHLTENGEQKTFAPDAYIRVNNSYMIKSALLADAGVAFLPRIIIEQEIKSGEIVEIPIFQDACPLILYALRAPSKHLPARTRAMWDFLAQRL